MTKVILGLVLVGLLTIPVCAQQQQQKYVPFTVDEKDARDLRTFLDEQPMKFSLPILKWMDALETKALLSEAEAKTKEDKPK